MYSETKWYVWVIKTWENVWFWISYSFRPVLVATAADWIEHWEKTSLCCSFTEFLWTASTVVMQKRANLFNKPKFYCVYSSQKPIVCRTLYFIAHLSWVCSNFGSHLHIYAWSTRLQLRREDKQIQTSLPKTQATVGCSLSASTHLHWEFKLCTCCLLENINTM